VTVGRLLPSLFHCVTDKKCTTSQQHQWPTQYAQMGDLTMAAAGQAYGLARAAPGINAIIILIIYCLETCCISQKHTQGQIQFLGALCLVPNANGGLCQRLSSHDYLVNTPILPLTHCPLNWFFCSLDISRLLSRFLEGLQ